MKTLNRLFILIICCGLIVNVTAQVNGDAMHQLTSDFNNKQYQLKILLPSKYSETDTVHYPVLYVLDGDYSTDLFQNCKS